MNSKKGIWLIISILLVLILIVVLLSQQQQYDLKLVDRKLVTKSGVCPPFYLFTEQGDTINPIKGKNTDKPYSPKQTCGKCHDYNKITQGFHFQQGKDEIASGSFADRYQWVTTPGNYGGNWCSPAPLYNYLSKKSNKSAKEMDMTSFTFITNGCGTCHPGGGPMEFDREGKRYDIQMDSMKYTAGGTNNFDGDYFQAYWNRTGVIEGDCNLCHQPNYNFKERNANLLKWNFRWLATIGSGFAKIEGSVKDSTEIKLQYDVTKFDQDGKVSMNLVREPTNETCLNCHAKPQWKKRGASFTAHNDVHIAKGLKCVDCHVAGSMATDQRIKGKEVHQFGKGDDPSGNVRNDLDNTVRTCADCHTKGYSNAPIAKHEWLPQFHLDKISCQACHIAERNVKSALVQVSDVYNPGVKITPPTKYIWTFYDQNMNYWNHYGELSMFTNKYQPSDPYYSQFAKYKGIIYPVNPVHSAWTGIYTEGKKGLDQPKMIDIYEMWTIHREDETKYPELSKIKDDNNDSIPEVNTADEINAIINSVTNHLQNKGYDLKGKQIVWVNNDRMYFNGNDYKILEKETWESSPYASVYKYNHDVNPARNALGINGCTDCHSLSSNIFYANIVKYPFDNEGNPVFEPQYKRLGMTGFMVWLSAVREQFVKTFEYTAILFLLLTVLISLICTAIFKKNYFELKTNYLTILYLLAAIGLSFIYLKPDLNSYILPSRLWFDKNHFIFSMIPLFIGIYSIFDMRKENLMKSLMYTLQLIFVGLVIITGFFIMIKFAAIEKIVYLSYTIFDLVIIGTTVNLIIYIINKQYKSIQNHINSNNR